MPYTLIFIDDESPIETIISNKVNSFEEADIIMNDDISENAFAGGDALLIDNITGESYYYMPDNNTNWHKDGI
jgi:hypothetical protein